MHVGAPAGSTGALECSAGQMNDQKMVEHVARQFIEQHGTNAVDILRGHADRAATEGDGPSSQTWLDIADLAERLLLKRERH